MDVCLKMKTFLVSILLTLSAFSEEPTKQELMEALQENPSNTWALYNLALQNYLEADFDGAAQRWEALKNLEPEDWQVREKLIQTYWGAGKSSKAVLETKELRDARESEEHKELNEKEFFICDQFQTGEIRAYVLEYYKMEGERPLALKFKLRIGEQKVDHYFSLGSYPSTTTSMRRNGDIGPDDESYHLDGYWDDGSHATYHFYRNRPNYADVREHVIRIIEGKKESISSTVPIPPKDEQGIDPDA